ncbi:efflux RND transporter periplasmic adaptor subunit [bacterium]|nr:efflux RND transporter periplasmic adaptor subunit [bacterium]
MNEITSALERRARASRGALLLLGALGLLAGCHRQVEDAPPEPVALVETVPARRGALQATLVAYGQVVPAPGGRRSLAVAFECRVAELRVSEGQQVAAGDTLLLLELSPESALLLRAAESAEESERQRLEAAQQRFDLGLATVDELAQARQSRADAGARSEELATWNAQRTVIAPVGGAVEAIPAALGALVPPGEALLTLLEGGNLELRMGVEPEDAHLVEPGQSVAMEQVRAARRVPPVSGTVRSVARAVDPDTRLVELRVQPGQGEASLLLGEFLRGEITVREERGLVVPRSALLPAQERYSLFTVKGGRVSRHLVSLGVETDSLVTVEDVALSAGDSVVVLGNYVLEDGMRVRTSPAETP